MMRDVPIFAAAEVAAVAEDDSVDSSSGERCSICLDQVIGDGRSPVKLICGHEFHLDCIGSAFNSKGAMQCPNCRNTEKGVWLYSRGNNSSRDEVFEYGDLTFGAQMFHLMISQSAPLSDASPSSGGGDSTPAVYHSTLSQFLLGNASPEPPFSITGSSISDNLFNNHWSTNLLGLNEPQTLTFPSPNHRYPNWDQHTPPHMHAPGNRLGNGENLSASQLLSRFHHYNNPARPDLNVHPFASSHSSGRRGSYGVYAGPRTDDPHLHAMQSFYDPQARPLPQGRPLITASRLPSQSETHLGSYAFPPNARNGIFQEAPPDRSSGGLETAHLPPNSSNRRMASWEVVHLPPNNSNSGERDSNWSGVLGSRPGSRGR